MKLTRDHLTFYQEKKTPLPRWVSKIAQPKLKYLRTDFSKPRVSIHRLIEVQVEHRPKYLEAQNLCAIVRLCLAGKRNVRELLLSVCYESKVPGNGRRKGYASKWLHKLGGVL